MSKMVHVEFLRKVTLFAIQFSGNFKLFDGLRADIVVRGNYGQKLSDLEILGIVEFMLFSVIRGPWGSIFVECQFFYPVAFFLGRGGGISPESGPKWGAQNDKNEGEIRNMYWQWPQKKPLGEKNGIRQK